MEDRPSAAKPANKRGGSPQGFKRGKKTGKKETDYPSKLEGPASRLTIKSFTRKKKKKDE